MISTTLYPNTYGSTRYFNSSRLDVDAVTGFDIEWTERPTAIELLIGSLAVTTFEPANHIEINLLVRAPMYNSYGLKIVGGSELSVRVLHTKSNFADRDLNVYAFALPDTENVVTVWELWQENVSMRSVHEYPENTLPFYGPVETLREIRRAHAVSRRQ